MLTLRRRCMMQIASNQTAIDFLERDDLEGVYYSSLHQAMNSVVQDYPSGLTKNVTINCITNVNEVRDPNDITKPNNLRVWTAIIKDWNKNTLYSLTINGNFKYTMSSYSLGGIRIENCDNIIIKNMRFYDYSNNVKIYSPEETAAVFSVGTTLEKNKNIVILNCIFDGIYKHSDGNNYFSDYAFDIKLTSNIVIQRCSFNSAAAIPLKLTDIDCVEIKQSYISSNIKRSTIAHESLCYITQSKRVEISDCLLDGKTLGEYGLSFVDCKEIISLRNKVYNFDGTVFNITGTEDTKCTFNSCLFFDNLKRYILSYLKFIIRIDQPINELNIINNTFYMNGLGPFFQEVVSVGVDAVTINNFNNIFIDKSDRSNAFIRAYGKLTNYNADYNLYKSYLHSGGLRFLATKILSCTEFEDLHSIDEPRSLSSFQNSGYEENSLMFGETVNLLKIELKIPSYELIDNSYLSNINKYSNLDIDYKIVTGSTSTVGCFNLYGVSWDESTDTSSGYTGYNIVMNETFNEYDIYTIRSDDGVILSSNTLNRNYLIKFTLNSENNNILKYGNTAYLSLDCNFDENGMYISDKLYDVNIDKLNF